MDEDALAEILPDLLSSPDLRAHLTERARELIDVAFDEALAALEDGSATDKAAVMKVVLPLAVRVHKDDVDTGEEAEKVHAETRSLFSMMQRALSGDEVDDLEA